MDRRHRHLEQEQLQPSKKLKSRVEMEEVNLGSTEEEGEESVVVFKSPNSDPALPSECWLHILEYVSGDAEILALVKACPEFDEMLKPRKTTHFLPLAIPLLIKLDYFSSRKNILLCRRITKRTKNAVDNTLKAYSTSSTYAFHPHSEQKVANNVKEIESINRHNIFSYRDCSSTLLNHYNHQPPDAQTNPFVTRNIQIHLKDICLDAQLEYEHFMSFQHMLRFGYNAHVAGITFLLFPNNDYGYDSTHLVAKLMALLREAPNVELVRVRTGVTVSSSRRVLNVFCGSPSDSDTQMSFVSNANAMAAREIRQMNIIPPLPKLVFLELDCSIIPEDIVGSFFTHYGRQLEALRCNGMLLVSTPTFNAVGDQPLKGLFPNLKKLHVVSPCEGILQVLRDQKGWDLELLELSNGWEKLNVEEFGKAVFEQLPKLQKVVTWNPGEVVTCNVITRSA